MGILEKISEIEREIARTQKNKGNVITLIIFNLCLFNILIKRMFIDFEINIQLLNITWDY